MFPHRTRGRCRTSSRSYRGARRFARRRRHSNQNLLGSAAIYTGDGAGLRGLMAQSVHITGGRYGKSLVQYAAPVLPVERTPLHQPVLVLNASYEPINVCAARRAIILVLKGVAMAEEVNGHTFHPTRTALRVPSVIRLLEYRRIPHQTRALSRKNILLRDRNTCQYCGV